jgi:hypothetical protein
MMALLNGVCWNTSSGAAVLRWTSSQDSSATRAPVPATAASATISRAWVLTPRRSGELPRGAMGASERRLRSAWVPCMPGSA